MNILLQDSSLGIWLLSVTDAGILTTTASSGTPGTLFLDDSGDNSWQVGVTTSGVLTATAVANADYATAFQLISPSKFSFSLQVALGGILTTTPSGFNPVQGGANVFIGRMRSTRRSEHLE